MKSPAPPKPKSEPVTDEERLRRVRILDVLTRAVGGYHVDSVANQSRCSNMQARLSLEAMAALGVVEQYTSYASSKLWRLKPKASA
jgi:DNA-binding IclR family transcriptional regulator